MVHLQPAASNIDQAGSTIGGIPHADHGRLAVQGNLLSYNSIGRPADKASVLSKEKEACLHSLSFLEIYDREHDICAPAKDTCDWLFRTTQFERWRAGTDLATYNGLLCIIGKPGTGKSTLMKHTLAHCKEVFPDHLIVAYFFHARGSALEKTSLGMLRSIVYQLIKQDDKLLEKFLNKFRDKQHLSQGERWEWRSHELKSFLASTIKHGGSMPFILLMDALDECNEADVRDVVDFLESLSSNVTRSSTTPRICVSRRHYPTLSTHRSLELIVEDNKDHEADITIYIQAKLAKRDHEIEDEIKRMADGIFIWVVLVVSLLNQAYLEGNVIKARDIVRHVPVQLDKIFSVLLSRDSGEMAETVLMLQWVLFSQRPLELAELFFAVKAGTASTSMGRWNRSSVMDEDIMQKQINHLSRGLVEVRRGRTITVQFIHPSVSDFLLRNNRLQTLDRNLELDPIGASHYRLWALCRSCIEHIGTVRTDETCEQPRHRYPFLDYAASCVFDHAEKVLAQGSSTRNNGEIGEWLREIDEWFEWWKTFLNATNHDRWRSYLKDNMDAGLLYMFSFLGYQGLVRSLLGKKAEVSARGGYYGNALQAASWRGHEETVRMLLKEGAEANAQGGYYGNALHAASAGGYEQVVKLLLDKGADVNAQGGPYGKALHVASAGGHEHVLRLLIDNGAEIDAQFNGSSALSIATIYRHRTLMEMLLVAGASIKSALRNLEPLDANTPTLQLGRFLKQTALCHAAATANEMMVRELLDIGVDVNSSSEPELTPPLHLAAESGRINVVRLLLAANADPTKEDYLGRTVHYYAQRSGSLTIAEELKHEVERINKVMRLALYHTISGGRTEVKWVEISRQTTDYILFSHILNEYKSTRRRRWWQYSLKGFQGVCFVEGTSTSFDGCTVITTEACTPLSKLLCNGTLELHHKIWKPPKQSLSQRIWSRTIWDELSNRPHGNSSWFGLRFLEGWMTRRIQLLALAYLLVAGLIGLLWSSLLKKTEAGFAITGCLIAAESLAVALMVFECQIEPAIS